MTATADLELILRRQRDGSYTADLRLQLPGSAAVADVATQVPVPLDPQALLELSLDRVAYGAGLAAMLFAEEELRRGWAQARAYADGHAAALRVCLSLDRTAAALQSLCWEAITDPAGGPLALSERVILSRTLASPDLSPVVIPSLPELHTLIAVAAPSDLATYQLAPFDAQAVITRVSAALDPLPATIIGAHPKAVEGRTSLVALIEHLRAGPQLVVLVCHGSFVDGEPYLWLEREDGAADAVPGRELAARLQTLSRRPLLIVLASCMSAGLPHQELALSALGPRLAQAGVAAVLAMQGLVPLATVERLLPTLFRELRRDGRVDRALAAARTALRGDPAWWVPALFLRARDGRLWGDTPLPPDLRRATEELGAYLGRALATHDAWLAEALPRLPPPPTQPYRALLAFTVADAGLFFGRGAVLSSIAERVRGGRLLVLHARSGAGKTSLLHAGLVPHLFDQRWLPIVVRTGDDPLTALKATLARPSLGPWPALLESLRLPELVGLLCQQWARPRQPLVLIFDQFEELFTLQPEPETRARFAAELAICLADPGLPLHVVLSLRGDYLTDLDSLAPMLPTILDSRALLTPMSQDEATEAITQPLARLTPPRSYDPPLLSALLTDLKAIGMELPHLQIICSQLYAALAPDEPQITLAHYQRLGGAAGILGGYLRQEVAALGRDAALARAVLIMLVTPDQTRQRLDGDALREQLVQHRNLDQLGPLLNRLCAVRLLHQETREGVTRYELAHDYLVGEVRAWVTPEDLAARQARDALRRALADWREQRVLLQPQTLTFVHAQREQLTGLTGAELELLLRSAVAHRTELATWALAAHRGGLEIWPVLRPLLTAPDHHVRAHAVAALAALGTAALPHLAAALSDPIAPVRTQAILALAHMADPAAQRALRANMRAEVAIPAHGAAPAFYLDRYLVTNADYAAFLADRPDVTPPAGWEAGRPPVDLLHHPVVGVSWHEATSFAVWAGRRLPSASEWQRAAGWPERRYPWGNQPRAGACNTREAGAGGTTEVGRYSPAGDSPHGAADLAGNVWEWLADPTGPAQRYRRLRGGAWLTSADFAHSDYDGFWLAPEQCHVSIGFRLCLDVPQEEPV